MTDSIDWYSFLARPRLPSPGAEGLEPLRNASILVTGAGGSIGRALSLRLASLHPRKLVLLDASEQALFRLQCACKAAGIAKMPTLLLVNVSDRAAIKEALAMYRPSLIFHAAAYKHVALLEEQPLAAIENNVLGTDTLLEAATHQEVERFVLLSTDKAVEPASILGATKQIAERLTLARKGIVVRLANVLGTEGSIVDVLLNNIHRGEPITLRGQMSERFFLTIEEAVDLLLSSALSARPGALLVPRLDHAHRVVDLANFVINLISTTKKRLVIFSELWPGEKVHEKLHASNEGAMEDSGDGLLCIAPACEQKDFFVQIENLRLAVGERKQAIALKTVIALATAYTPSSTVLSGMNIREAGVSEQ